MFGSTEIACSLSALSLVYNVALTGFRLSTFELYSPLEAVGTSACVAIVNLAMYALNSRQENKMEVRYNVWFCCSLAIH